MNKTGILCSKDSDILHDFSKRCVDRLLNGLIAGMPLPFFRTYMMANVEKEVNKDCIIIEYVAFHYHDGSRCSDYDIEELFDLTKQVDKDFLRKVTIPSLSIKIRYEDIASIRKARIDLVSKVVRALLDSWKGDDPIEDAVRSAYGPLEFREVMTGILHLYNLETKNLGNSINLFGPLRMAVSAFTETLYRTMEEVMTEMVDAYVKALYRGRSPS